MWKEEESDHGGVEVKRGEEEEEVKVKWDK